MRLPFIYYAPKCTETILFINNEIPSKIKTCPQLGPTILHNKSRMFVSYFPRQFYEAICINFMYVFPRTIIHKTTGLPIQQASKFIT